MAAGATGRGREDGDGSAAYEDQSHNRRDERQR
jgi:hypothetical protein